MMRSAPPEAEETARQYALGYAAQALGFAIPLVSNLLFPVLMGPESFGIFTVAAAFAYLGLVLIEPGLVAAMVERTASPGAGPARWRVVRRFVMIRLAVSAIGGAAIALSASHLAAAWGLQERAGLVRLSGALLLAIGLYASLDTALIALQRNDLSVRLRLIANASCLGTPIIAWLALRTPESVLAGTAFGFAVAAAAAAFFMSRAGPPPLGEKRAGDPPSEQPDLIVDLRLVAAYSALYLAAGIQSWGVVALAGLSAPASSVGHLKIAVGIVQAAITLAPVPSFVVLSYLVSLRGDRAAFGAYFNRVVSMAALISPAFVAACVLLAPRAVTLLYGPAYEPVAGLLALVSLSYPALLLLQPGFQALVLLEGRAPSVRAFLCLIALEGLLAGLLLAHVGAGGAALTLAIGPYLFQAWILSRLARHGLRLPLAAYARGMAAATLLAAGCWLGLFLLPSLGGLLLAAGLGLLGFAAAIWLFARSDPDLRDHLRSFLARASFSGAGVAPAGTPPHRGSATLPRGSARP